MFKRGDRIEPTDENEFLCGGIVMEDSEITNDTDFSNRSFAVYVKLDNDFYPEFYDVMRFRRVG